MLRTMLTTAVLGVAVLGSLSQVAACDACARRFQTTEGKLIKVVAPIYKLMFDVHPIWPEPQSARTPLAYCWVLQVGKKTYTLELGSRTLTRLAARFEGMDVIVTGPIKGDTIEVSDITTREQQYTGTLDKHTFDILTRPGVEAPSDWILADGKTMTRLIFESRGVARKAQDLVGKQVRVTGKMTSSGLRISDIEAAK